MDFRARESATGRDVASNRLHSRYLKLVEGIGLSIETRETSKWTATVWLKIESNDVYIACIMVSFPRQIKYLQAYLIRMTIWQM